ncbi:MAG: hypothetical protein ABGZ24_18135, partial [Fuerstiella sp.]
RHTTSTLNGNPDSRMASVRWRWITQILAIIIILPDTAIVLTMHNLRVLRTLAWLYAEHFQRLRVRLPRSPTVCGWSLANRFVAKYKFWSYQAGI